ncbi:MAG: ion transporter [Bacteroidales bacterium]|nr:ion transporter [Bacteroidales bacterium]
MAKISKTLIHEIIFEADTKAGKFFDLALLVSIICSVIVVMLDSIESVRLQYHLPLLYIEYLFTALFTIEYALRIWSIKRPAKYILSFYGIIDLLAIIPTYISFVFVGYQSLIVIRVIRLLRVFRIMKLGRYVNASEYLTRSFIVSRHKILVFLYVVFAIVIVMGSVMYIVEGPPSGFENIPTSIYWAIVTLTTVGYGDIAPATPLGQIISSMIMIMGYAIIAVPTGILTSDMIKLRREPTNTQSCINCSFNNHDIDAIYCKKCGAKLLS